MKSVLIGGELVSIEGVKYFWKIAICFASALVLSTGLCASSGSSNPYGPIVTRNIFNLNPPQPIDTTKQNEPPSTITPDGIMTIFGTRQVLFKVAIPPRPPTPATEKSYILSEGQQQDDIEVTHINEKTGMVTFNNHGVVQEIPLVKAPPLTTPTPVVMNTVRPLPPIPVNNFGHRPGEEPAGMASNFNPNRSPGNPDTNSGNPGYGAGNYSSAGNAQNQQQLSPEEQTILIAAQKAQAKQAGDPVWKIYPPTELDEDAGTVNSVQPSGGPPSP